MRPPLVDLAMAAAEVAMDIGAMAVVTLAGLASCLYGCDAAWVAPVGGGRRE